MSSFNIGGPNNKPQVTEAQNMMNNGGGGNTGYMQSRGKKKKKPEETIDPVILEGEAEDKFEYVEDEYEDDDDYYNTSKNSSRNSSFDVSKSDDKFIKNDEEDEEEEFEENGKNPVKKVVFGLIDKFADRISEKTLKKRDDDNPPGGDFLSLSGKDI